MTIIFPRDLDVVGRWQQAARNDRLIEWRALAFLFASEAKYQRDTDPQGARREMIDDLITLHELAMQHVYRLYPVEVAA